MQDISKLGPLDRCLKTHSATFLHLYSEYRYCFLTKSPQCSWIFVLGRTWENTLLVPLLLLLLLFTQ